MKFWTSYFYQIRFFKPWMIPISTAKWDPKWYHNDGKLFQDKNGVINGLNLSAFNPEVTDDGQCHGPETCSYNSSNCRFLKNYHDQIFSLDFQIVMNIFENYEKVIHSYFQIDHELEFVLIFHEVPSNPCSERGVVQEYFRSHGVEINEWNS